MPFNAKQFCIDHNIQSFPPGTKNVGPGWIGVKCPMCPDPSSHGGFNVQKEYYSCHRCKSHPMITIIAKLTNTNYTKAKQIIEKYTTGHVNVAQKQTPKWKNKQVKWPANMNELSERHKKYLKSRNFDPDELIKIWDLKGTGHIGRYKHRIIVPIYLQNQIVSWQARDITDKHESRYLPCPKKDEMVPHKHTLYGFDQVPNNVAILTEGVTDVWRLGPGAVCCFGTQFTTKQIVLLGKNFKRIGIMFDYETQAQLQADGAFDNLGNYGVETEIITLSTGDPCDLTNDEAKKFMKEFINETTH